MVRYLALSFLLCSTPAFADAIDGEWCSAAKHLAIKGPEITLPSGVMIKGDYHRHEFMYQAPAGDADAGSLIYMRLLGEDDMNLYHMQNEKLGEPEAYKRCAPEATS